MEPENMTVCKWASGQLKLFIDDLLTEEDFARFTTHVDDCEKCKRLVRTVGSLSNQLWELGELEVPSDFTETVAFQTRHKPAVVKGSAAAAPGPYKKALITLLVVSLAAAGWFALRQYRSAEAPPPEAPRRAAAEPLELTVTDPSSEAGVHAAFEAFLSSEPSRPVPAPSDPAAAASTAAEPVVPAPDPAAAVLAASQGGITSVHWHYVYADDREAAKALELIRLYAPSVSEGNGDLHFIHFVLPAGRARELAQNLRNLSTAVAPLRDYEVSLAPAHDNTAFQISLYLQRAGEDDTTGNHWHLRVMGLTKPEQIQEVISQEQGMLEYDARNFIICSIPASRIEALKNRLRVLPGTSCEFEQQPAGNATGSVKVAIYILEG